MGLEDAVLNLEQNALHPLSKELEENRDLLRRALRSGRVLETKLAYFVIEPGSLEVLEAAA